MRLYKRNEIGAATKVAVTTSGTYINFQEGADEKTAFIVNASAADEITVFAGAGSINANNITLEVKSGLNVFTLDSAFFMDGTGEHKGSVKLKSKTNSLDVYVVVLP